MKNWILICSPDTYEIVKAKNIVAVRQNTWKRFSEEISKGDNFIIYVSKLCILDAIGRFKSDANFVEEMFNEERFFPCRRKIEFLSKNLAKPVGSIFSEIEPFRSVNTGPGNFMVCKGGFVELSDSNFNKLCNHAKS